MDLTLGFSPCPNDTFMFAALVNQWIDTQGLNFDVHMADVEQLNEWAGFGKLDITKMSFHRAIPLENEYQLLSTGSALGIGCGPILISKKYRSKEEIENGPVALPGQWTTAHLLFNLFYPLCHQKEFHLFSEIEKLVSDEKVVAGVIIHENRFTYEAKGLVKINDLGEAWETATSAPIPLGGIFADRRLDVNTIQKVDLLIRDSIHYAYNHPDQVMDYVRLYSQEMEESVMKSHIDLYVNEFSLNLGQKGHDAVAALKKSFR
ncbi:MAG: 1,4-dihydroxy-6-naphthoate synthase [Bacteroidota bacterium]|nr:1,4-dihydroxy-6-naphthoate synthase [Bacteroidota bacterium]